MVQMLIVRLITSTIMTYLLPRNASPTIYPLATTEAKFKRLCCKNSGNIVTWYASWYISMQSQTEEDNAATAVQGYLSPCDACCKQHATPLSGISEIGIFSLSLQFPKE